MIAGNLRPSLLLVLGALSLSSRGAAQSPAAMAESLYLDGKRLLDEKKYAEACPKLAESERLEPAGGTELALALCYDEWGKIASAWAAYRDALASARKAGRKDREKASQDAIARLEPLLPKLTVRVAPEAAALDGIEVRRDGVVLGKIAWGTPIPVDPGEVHVEALAPGHLPFKTSLTISGPRDEKTILVPPLQRAETPRPPASSSPSSSAAPTTVPSPTVELPPQDSSLRKPLGYASLGLGVVGLGLGAYLGSRFFSKKSDADAICPGSTCSDRHAVDLSKQAQTSGILGSVSLAIGLAGVGVGSYLLFFGPEQRAAARPAPSLAVVPLQGGGAALLSGSYLASTVRSPCLLALPLAPP
jgi:serine/threonine-protein kinase